MDRLWKSGYPEVCILQSGIPEKKTVTTSISTKRKAKSKSGIISTKLMKNKGNRKTFSNNIKHFTT